MIEATFHRHNGYRAAMKYVIERLESRAELAKAMATCKNIAADANGTGYTLLHNELTALANHFRKVCSAVCDTTLTENA